MEILKPRKLNKNELIGLISPASSPDELSKIDDSVSYLERLGYSVALGKNVGKINGYLAGTDQERVDDLHYMFKKKEVKAIFCLRGGYGSGRILDKIDYNLIKKNPKILVGYSDITSLQMAILKKTGLITFAGPMLLTDFLNQIHPSAEEIFWITLTSNKKIGKLKSIGDKEIQFLRKGRTIGRLIGGNLSTFVSLIGSDYLPKLDKCIILLEETCEPPYKIDRMFNQLRISGILKNSNGVLLGAFNDCLETNPEKNTLTLGEVIQEYLGNLKKPVLYNLSHGHIKENLILPIGLNVKLNSEKKIIEFAEKAVV